MSLTIFGGLSTEVAPTDLPEGASPLNWDMDFDIGATYTRPGLTPAFSFDTPGAGPNVPSRSGSVPANNVNWEGDSVTWCACQSPTKWWNGFGFNTAHFDVMGAITGIEVTLTGHHEGEVNPQCYLQLTKSTDGTGIGEEKIFYLNPVDMPITFGGPSDSWSAELAVSDVNQNLGVQFFAIMPEGEATVQISSITLKIYSAPVPSNGNGQNTGENVDWVKTFIEDDGTTHTFVLDSGGTLWEEDVTNRPGVLVAEINTIYPDQFAFGASNLNEEWIAFSDLQHGTNIPRHGTNFDRISQVGPGDPPGATGVQIGGTQNTWPIASITQDNTVQKFPGVFDILWSAGPGLTTPGNVLTIYYEENVNKGGHGPSPVLTNDFQLGGAVNLSNMQNVTSCGCGPSGGGLFAGLNGTYRITGVGFSLAPCAGQQRWYFTVQTPQNGPDPGPDSSNPQNNCGGQSAPSLPMHFQPTMATLTLAQPANLAVGDRISIQGAGCYNGTWTILNAVDGGALTITATSFANGVATYTFIVNGATPQPVVGQEVTVIGALNGPINPATGTSIFNVVAQPITSVSGGQFTVNIANVLPDTCLGTTNVMSQDEPQASAIVLGTVYQFDPGLSFLRTLMTTPVQTGICPNVTAGGTVTKPGGLGGGIRKAVTIFETRNGYITAPSAPVIFETTGADNSVLVCNVDIGPPDVIKRIIAFTPGNGGQFFYIPEAVKVQSALGPEQIYGPTVINDNTSTSATFTFTDAVLMAATAIDIQGNNLFNQIEVGASCAVIPYAGRNFYVMQQNKVQNLVNTTFDGGYLPKAGPIVPAGWTADANQTGGQLVYSPVFGFSYYIGNGAAPQNPPVPVSVGATPPPITTHMRRERNQESVPKGKD